jgi:hypothetical protein
VPPATIDPARMPIPAPPKNQLITRMLATEHELVDAR